MAGPFVRRDGITDGELIESLTDGPFSTETIADRHSIGRGRTRARLQTLTDRGLVVPHGTRTNRRWGPSEAGREMITSGSRALTDGGDPETTGDDRFDPNVEEVPVEIGDREDGWGGLGDLSPATWKVVGAAVIALVVLLLVLIVLRKLRG